MKKGPEALTDRELIALILGSGNRSRDVMALAGAVERALQSADGTPRAADLLKIEGLGAAKACQIAAAVELSRRKSSQRAGRVTSPESILPAIAFIANKPQEYLVCVSLTGAGEIIQCRVVSIGALNATSVHPREVFADPISDRAAAVILAHNHPSGTARPSRRDIAVNRKLVEAGKLLGISVLDHLILTPKSFFSFRKRGLIARPTL